MDRQQERLKQQNSQLKEVQAALKRQKSSLNRLTKNTETALSQLRKEAEKAPSERFIRLTKQCEELNGEILALTVRKTQVVELVQGATDTLDRLDQEIITTDGVYKEILDKLITAKKQLQQVRRDTTFQVAVESDLKNEILDLQKVHKELEASLIYSQGEIERINKLRKKVQLEVDSLTNELKALTPRLKRSQTALSKNEVALTELGKRDKVLRDALAQKELKLRENESSFKSQKAEFRQEVQVMQQVQPNLPKPLRNKNKGYYNI